MVIENGILHKKWVSQNLKITVLQVVVARQKVKDMLEEANKEDSSSDGHFGISKTLRKINSRFYYASCKSDVEELMCFFHGLHSKERTIGERKVSDAGL